MLKRKLIPTPLIDLSRTQIVEIPVTTRQRSTRLLEVLKTLLGWFLGGLWLRLTRRFTSRLSAERLREAFESLGGIWIKLGQLLSLRTDAFSAEMCEELARLHYRAEGFSPAIARKVVEEELGRPIEDVFEVFDDEPVAAASICQVHRAVLRRKHRNVVVKVQRPDVHDTFLGDMGILSLLVKVLDWVGLASHIRWYDALWEMEQTVLEETDYRYEAANVRRMKQVLKKDRIYAPKVYERYCTQRVLVLEFIDGVLLSDFIRHRDADPLKMRAWLCQNNIDPRKVGRRLFLSAMRQVLEENLFHGDLHPGNVVLLKDSRLALIDFGTIGSVDVEFLEHYKLGLRALASRDYAKAADYTLRMCDELPVINVAELRSELVRCYRLWDAKTVLKGVPYHERSLAAPGAESGKVMYARGVNLSFTFMRISRTWMTLDAALNYLIPEANYIELFGRHFAKAALRESSAGSVITRVTRSVEDLSETAREMHVLVAPMVRRQTLVFQGTTTKLARFYALVCRMGALLLTVYGLFLFLTFLHQHHPRMVSRDPNALGAKLAHMAPVLTYHGWCMILAGLVVGVLVVWRAAKMLEAKEYGKNV